MNAKSEPIKEKKIVEKVGNVRIPIYPTATKGYDGFTVAWYEGGKRSRKFFADLGDAKTHARLVATKIENQERQVLTLVPEDARLFVSCTAKLRPLGVSLEEAVREFVAARKIVGSHPLSDALQFWKVHHGGSIPDKSLPDVITEFVSAQERDGVSVEYFAELKRFLAHVGSRFQMNIASVSTAMLDEYLRSMECAAGSRNTYRRKLVALFNYARRVGYLQDKATAADKTAKAKEAGREIEIYRPSEMALLLAHATDGLRPFLVLCGFCGLRPAEARRLDWNEVNFRKGFIEVKAANAKTAARRLAALPANAKAWLRLHAKTSGKVVELSRVIHALQRLHRRVNTVLEKAGKEPMEMPRNALRHSFVSYRLALIQNASQTALEAGHDVRILFRHYRELVSKGDAVKWFALQPETAPNVVSISVAQAAQSHSCSA